jgi:hypothetical protein
MLFGTVVKRDKDDSNFERVKSSETIGDEPYDTSRASLLVSSVFKSQGIHQRDACNCLVYMQYNVVGQQPLPDAGFSLCFSIISPLHRRWYFVQKPQSRSRRLLVDLHFDDISSITGYSKMYHSAGFTIHADALGIEIHMVPQDPLSRNDWMRAVAECRLRVCKGKSREQWNNAAQRDLPHSCALCGESSPQTLLCPTTNLPHPSFIRQFLHNSSPGAYLASMVRRTVMTVDDTDRLIAASREALRRGYEAAELLEKVPPPLALF